VPDYFIQLGTKTADFDPIDPNVVAPA